MPLVLKEPRDTRPYYSVRGTYLGIYINRSTKTADRATAKKVLKQFEKDIERGRFTEEVKKGPTFTTAAARYVRDGHEGRFLDRIAAYFGDTPIDQIDQEKIDDAAHALYPTSTNATRNRQVYSPVSAVLRHAGVDLRLRRPAGANGARREFTFRQEQADALIRAAMEHEEEFGLLLLFLLYTGCRLGEALSLTIDDMELQHATALARDTKNGTNRRVHLPPQLVAALACHPRGLDREGKLFRYHKGQRLYQRLERACAASGVDIPDGVAFHAFRHTWASWMRRYAGLDTTGLVATGAWLSPDAARRYEHAVASEEAQRADMLPVIGAFGVRGSAKTA